MEIASLGRYRLRELGILYAAWVGLLLYIFSTAWVAEDAYITFRVLENFMHGYGLRWNIDERVQVYTHPLWLLLHIPVLYWWNNPFQVTIVLSLVCSMAAVLVALAAVKRPVPFVLACLLVPLACSKSFIDYATSGLENPLSYLIFAAFGYVLLKKSGHPHFWFYCSLTVALALVNRLDTGVLYAPVLCYLVFSNWRKIEWHQIVLGATPLIAWCYFALFYYGFLFPNTKYAKLNTGMDVLLFIQQGLHYAKYLLIVDIAGTLAILSSLLFIIFPRLSISQAPARLPQLGMFIALGVYLDFFYVIYVGGDYMMGRFWAFPIFVSVWLWYAFAPRLRPDVCFLIACTLIAGWAASLLLADIRRNCSDCIALKGRVIDAANTFNRNKLVTQLYPLQIRTQGRYPFGDEGVKIAKEHPPVKTLFYIGMTGYYAGPDVHVIDMLGLADPLLARLPASKRQNFYIAHFRRDVPRGYEQAIITGSPKDMPPPLARYYDKLRLITSGRLLDSNRLKTILLFNLGYYDHWRDDYLNRRF